MKRQLLQARWQLCQTGTEDWMDTQVSGSVLETLLSYNRVEAPYYGRNDLIFHTILIRKSEGQT